MTSIKHRLTVVVVALTLALAASVVPSDYASALPCEDCSGGTDQDIMMPMFGI